MRKFDYGTTCRTLLDIPRACNQAVYGQLIPPAYNLSSINNKLVLFTGEQSNTTACCCIVHDGYQSVLRTARNGSIPHDSISNSVPQYCSNIFCVGSAALVAVTGATAPMTAAVTHECVHALSYQARQQHFNLLQQITVSS